VSDVFSSRWTGRPDGVAVETVTFVELPGGRTRLEGFSLADSFEARDGALASGMNEGIVEGYQRLDEVLGA